MHKKGTGDINKSFIHVHHTEKPWTELGLLATTLD